MFERMMHSNEIIGLTMMLLLVMALVASQAGATIEEEEGARPAAVIEQTESLDAPGMPFSATVEGHFNGNVLTISIDTMAKFGSFRIQDN